MEHACGRTSAWINNDKRPELKTLHGRVLRFVLLWLLFGLWIVGLASFIALWLFSGFCVLRSVWNGLTADNWTPLPLLVQVYLSAMAMYESYHYVTRDSLHLWPLMRRLVRYVFLHYPYFRLNVVVFEEREEEKKTEPEIEQDCDEEDDGHLTAKAAVAAVEENDVTP
ncbi:hypothetical protein PHMEG_00011026, partial [Phytophthora megakarya]